MSRKLLLKTLCVLILLSSAFNLSQAQQQFQTVSGTVVDKETQIPIENAAITIIWESNRDSIRKTNTNAKGEFSLSKIWWGRNEVSINAKGYTEKFMSGIIVTSGKQLVLNVELDAQINQEIDKINEVKITAKKSHETNNDGALISARLFTVEETDRFAGSRGDPARMASNFAGVQGADDSRNDIVVRGNSPAGILWRIEGIDIPNPNHFAIPGTTGGSVSIINNKILANSDFFTGAFPAEYGNGISGAFDLKLRAGNTKRHEVSTQFGILGWDGLFEGPLNKKGASYLITYRYSTLSMLSALKVPIGTDAVPNYQDASFHFKFPLKNNAKLSFFGIGGISKIDILISDKLESSRNLYGDNDRDQYFGSRMGVVGAAYQKPISNKAYFKIVASYNHQSVNANHSLVFRTVLDTFERDGETFNRFRNDSLVPNLDYLFRTQSIGSHAFINYAINSSTTLKYGLQYTHYMYTFFDSARNLNPRLSNYWTWSVRWNAQGTGDMFLPYVQIKNRWSRSLTTVLGVQSQIFRIAYNPYNSSFGGSPESHWSQAWILPRFSARYQLDKRNSFNFGTGIHAQNQSAYIYFYNKPDQIQPHNLDMGLTKSAHYILGWDHQLGKASRIKVETYYQNLWDIPIEKINPLTGKGSSFSLANTGSGFSRFFPGDLYNEGVGYNYGLELTVEKFFSKGFYYLFSGSVFDAEYKGSDGIWRNSDFNTDYAMNALIAKEFTVKKNHLINIGGKATFAGARRFSPIDSAASVNNREYVELDAQKNTQRFDKPYMRFDLRISYRINSKKVSHEIAFDFINITNNKNILNYTYINEPPYRRVSYQLGLLPLFYYKMDFAL